MAKRVVVIVATIAGIGLVVYACGAAVVFSGLRPLTVTSVNMAPTIAPGDWFVCDLRGAPTTGSVVVFDDPSAMNPVLVSRVIATPYQRIDIKNGVVTIDGAALDEPYLDGAITQTRNFRLPYTVPRNSVWVMGDNRSKSVDSRTFGPIPLDEVRAVATVVFWPVPRAASLISSP